MPKKGSTNTKEVYFAGLTLKEYNFANEYIRNGGNATQAAIKAYPDATYETAEQLGFNNIRKNKIIEYIGSIIKENDLKKLLLNAVTKDLNSGHNDLRKNAIQAIIKILGIGNQQNIKIEDLRKEYGGLEYGSYSREEVEDINNQA